MRAVGVDFGQKRIGLAVGDLATGLASPRPTQPATGTLARDAEAIAALAKREEATAVVIGLPLDAEGQETPMCRVCRLLGSRVEELGLQVSFVDETLTSQAAHADLERQGLTIAQTKRRLDSEAACRILERFFADAR